MKGAAGLGIKLYMQTEVVSGFIYQPCEERLLDLLNGVSVRRPESRGSFFELTDVTIQHVDGKEERLATAYINKAIIQLAATLDGDSARGFGGKAGPKPYPFVQKSPVPVRLRLPAYTLTGAMHCARGERACHVLEERLTFLPLTNVKVRARANGMWWKAPFVAVNREQIIALHEEGIPLLEVYRHSAESYE